ncbi:S8 family peptidase [Chitinimonas arctica]|uniref:S8 family peptidase n=1 Tax=Chitinimonas arctica TaxID=2594795 RepID=UPI0015D41B8B|nr:S8 family peptidase [Chitinimonas arctica]
MTRTPVQWAVLAVLSGLASTAFADDARHPYIVQLADKPVASYTGGVAGLKATQPAPGKRLDVQAADVQAYINYLGQKQSNVTAIIGNAPVVYEYKLVFNGFSAMLTDAEVRALKKSGDVLAITADQPRELLSNYTPKFLGLDKPGVGLWSQLGGIGAAGEDVVVGIVDSGVWPENAAFADRIDASGNPTNDPSGTLVYGAPPSNWRGTCEIDPSFRACNNKLIGAQIFRDQYDALIAAGTYTPHWSDYRSPRDNGGHGTHTASTAAGNHGVLASVAGVPMGKTSGMAPRARVAVYKVCWSYDNPALPGTPKNSCFNADSVKAIDKAVEDGVNVINYSISGSQTSVMDPVEQAFFGAANAGVFVAASAGNSGPANQVAHISPWLTTVAASTHDRYLEGSTTLGNGATYKGASMNPTELPQTAVVLSSSVGLPGASLNDVRLCFNTAVLDPAKVAGKIVVCDRGTNPLVDKSAAVHAAGGAGMLLVNVSGGATTQLAVAHSVPTVHVNAADGALIKTYAATGTGQASIGVFTTTSGGVPAPAMAGFSSRGPNKGDLNTLKPDVTAPGVDILAGYVPPQTEAERNAINDGSVVPPAAWDFLQGTSMSSPHVAGLAALLHQQHPSWSPAAIKSALMTTGYNTLDDGQPGMSNGRLPWAQGAGHVNPNSAADPGLVYDANTLDYVRYMCGNNVGLPASICSTYGSIAPYNLNLASLTAGSVLGQLTFTRTVKNVGSTVSTYNGSATITGFNATVTPASLTLNPGESKSFTVKLTRTTAPQEAWQYGSLVWSDGTHTVRSPLTARAAMLAAPALLTSESATGNKVFTVGTGFAGALTAVKGGMKEATVFDGTVNKVTGDGVAECAAGSDPTGGVKVHQLVVPAGNLVTRVAMYNSETGHGDQDDLDLLVLNSNGVAVGSSGSSTSDELVQTLNLAAGTYNVCVIGYAPRAAAPATSCPAG